jgi:hypothetical protein
MDLRTFIDIAIGALIAGVIIRYLEGRKRIEVNTAAAYQRLGHLVNGTIRRKQ